jgi:hypothetical protein
MAPYSRVIIYVAPASPKGIPPELKDEYTKGGRMQLIKAYNSDIYLGQTKSIIVPPGFRGHLLLYFGGSLKSSRKLFNKENEDIIHTMKHVISNPMQILQFFFLFHTSCTQL